MKASDLAEKLDVEKDLLGKLPFIASLSYVDFTAALS